LLVGGCATGRSVDRNRGTRAGETYTVNPPQAIFDASAMRMPAEDERGGGSAGSMAPWYVDRNDGRLNVRPGGSRASVSRFVVVTRDQQRSHNGEIHNQYRREVRSVESGALVR